MSKILSNQIKCNNCGGTPFSKHRHDYVECLCRSVAVDGGMDYLKRVGTDYTEMSIVITDEEFEACMEKLKWCIETRRNDLGRLCAIFIALRDSGYIDRISKEG